MTILDAQVGTHDLRKALVAVLPHVCRDEQLPMLCRVRLYVSPEHVFVAATDRFTMALARVSVWQQVFPAHGIVDLAAEDVASIVQVHNPGKDAASADCPQWQVNLALLDTSRGDPEGSGDNDVAGPLLRVTDASGLFGELRTGLDLVTLPVAPSFPDLPKLLGGKARVESTLNRSCWPAVALPINLEYQQRFLKAQKAYSVRGVLAHPTWWRASDDPRSAVNCTISDSFIGALQPICFPDGVDDAHRAALVSWAACLGSAVPYFPILEEPTKPRAAAAARPSTPPAEGRPDDVVVSADEPVLEDESPAVPMLSAEQEMLRQACVLVVRTQFGSSSQLQRVLRIGFGRAQSLLARLEYAGIVGAAPGGSNAREVLYPADRLDDALKCLESQ